MTLISVVAVFMLAGILFPIVLVLLAVVLDSGIAAWWAWSWLHAGRSHRTARHVAPR